MTGLLLSTTAAVFAFRSFDADESQRFSEAVDEIHGDLQKRLDFFANSVRQLAGVYALKPDLTQNKFLDYTSSTGIRASDAGIWSYGVFRRQKGATRDLDHWFLELRQIGPAAPKIVSPLGQDVTSNKERVELFNHAVDEASAVIATHVPGLPPNQSSGQMMTAAAYEGNHIPDSVEERRKRAIGVAYARFSEAGLFDQVLQNAGSYKSHLDMQVFDDSVKLVSGLKPKPLYEHQSPHQARSFPRSAFFEIHVGQRPFAVRVLSNHSPLWSTAAIVSVLILALGIAASLLAFRIIRLRERKSEIDMIERAKSQANAEFLEEISSILATSLEPVVVAEMLTKKLLAVCDWCVIELLDGDGVIDRHQYSASSPERHDRLKKFYDVYPPQTTKRRLTNRARETKETQYIEIYNGDTMAAWIPDPERLRLLTTIGFESVVIIPLMSQDRVLGTLAMYSGDPRHLYSPQDVQYFEDIAMRSSLAFENARLYAESQNLNRAKDNFLAMLSHELRTPMNVILGWLEILSTEDVDKETYDQALETLNRNAKVQIQLINDLLDVSRIINGKLSLHASDNNLGTVASGAVDSVQPAVRAKNIATSLKTEGDLSAMVDAERIQQVLWNLLSNAVKFTPNDGSIHVSVIGDTGAIRIVVADSGQGIDPAFLPFVFDRFRQEEGGFTRTQGGLGLGLSIVRYIVEGHGGTIHVESNGRGFGSRFTVVLPKTAQITGEIQFTPPAL